MLGTGNRSQKITLFHELFLTVPSCKVAFLFYKEQGVCRDGASCWNSTTPVLFHEVTATQVVELLASVSAGTQSSDIEVLVEPESRPQSQALNHSHSIV